MRDQILLNETHEFNVFQFVFIRGLFVLLLPDVWHVAPVISAMRHICRIRVVVDKAIDSRRIKDIGQIIDHRRIRWIPAQVNRSHAVMAECGCGNEGAESRVRTHCDDLLDNDLEDEQDTEESYESGHPGCASNCCLAPREVHPYL